MTEKELIQYITNIRPADALAMRMAEERQAKLAKPPGSLGKLEDISIRLAGVTGQVKNRVEKTAIAVFAADNGVVRQGVSCTPVDVTRSQAINMTRHLTGMSSLAKNFGCHVRVTDVGIVTDTGCADVFYRKVRYGTDDISEGPAMTREQAIEAICVGIEAARELKKMGMQAVGIGEMGIGNTTTSAAVLACLAGLNVTDVTGRGGGLTDEAFTHKKEIVTRALEINAPNPADPIDVIAKVGGLDIAAMAGCYLGCAAERIAAVVDGYISIVAALVAYRLCSAARDFMFLSHASFEVGYMRAAGELRLEPSLLLGMRLGEGSGCPIMFKIMEAACAVMCDMATFEEASIEDDYLEEIRKVDAYTVEDK